MKIRKLTNEEIKGACAFAVSIYNIAIRGCFRTLDCHRYFDEYMDELKGYYFSEDYQEKAKTKTFKQLLDEHAVASDTINFKR